MYDVVLEKPVKIIERPVKSYIIHHTSYIIHYLSFSSFNMALNPDENIESIKLKSSAQKKPSTLIPSINLSAMMMMSALITNRKRPRVSMVNGRVSMISIGFTMAFNTASTKAKMIAVM